MPKGDFPTRMIPCKHCGQQMPNRHMGNHVRHAHPDEIKSHPYRGERNKYGGEGEAVECKICGREVDPHGMGKHMQAHIRNVSLEEDEPERVKRAYNKRGEWTVSLVNGQKQIAAKVTDQVAKRIIAMLVQ